MELFIERCRVRVERLRLIVHVRRFICCERLASASENTDLHGGEVVLRAAMLAADIRVASCRFGHPAAGPKFRAEGHGSSREVSRENNANLSRAAVIV